jgi:hypothetical protein
MKYNVISIRKKMLTSTAIFMIVAFSIMSISSHFSYQTSVSAQTVIEQVTNDTQEQPLNKLDCISLGKTLDGIPVPNGNICDVVIVRNSPQIIGHDGLVMNEFTLMNSVIEFKAINTTSPSSFPSSSSSSQNVYVMGDFALLESEMNPVLQTITKAEWNVTGIHNHMIMESPKTTFMHWTAQGDINTIIGQIKLALGQTSILGP